MPTVRPAIAPRALNRFQKIPRTIAGLTVGISFTAFYIIATQYAGMDTWFGISAEGIGFVGALLNLAVAIPVALSAPPPSATMQELIESIRYPGPPAEARRREEV